MKIRLSATDETGRAFQGTIGNLDSLGRAGERVEASFDRVGRSIISVGNIAERGLAIAARYEISQLSLQGAAEGVRSAEERAARARVEYGEGSRKATEAARELEAALRNQEKTQIRADLSMALAVGNVAGLGVEAVRAARNLGPMIAGLRSATVAAGALSIAASGPLAPITAAAIAGGLVTLAVALNDTGTAAEKTASDITDAGVAADMAAERMERLREKFVFGAELVRQGAIATQGLAGLREEQEKLQAEAAAVRVAFQLALGAGMAENANLLLLKLREVKGALGQVEQAIEGIEAPARRAAEEVAKATKKAAEDAARAHQAAAERAATSWRTANEEIVRNLTGGFGTVGVNLSNVTVEARQRILALSGVSKSLQNELLSTAVNEEKLTIAALKSSEALRGQADITAKKDETTEHFVRRLLGMGVAEAEVAARLDVGARRLLSQEEAARRAAMGVDQLGRALKTGLNVEELTTHFGPRVLRLLEEVEQRASRAQKAVFNAGAAGLVAQAAAGQAPPPVVPVAVQAHIANVALPGQGFGPQLAQTAYVALPGQNIAPPAAASSATPWTPPSPQGLQPWTPTLADELWAQAMLAQAQALVAQYAIPAAHGFHGDVTGPTLFMAGERGRERVDITPGSSGRGDGGPVVINVDARGATDPAAVRRAARRGAEEGVRASFTARRLATRRTR